MAGPHTEPTWRRSRRCGSSSCVEVATDGDTVMLRDSDDPDGPRLTFSAAAWQAFLADLRAGRCEDPGI